MISSCTSARRSNPTSTARSPRAIMTPATSLRIAASSNVGRFSNAVTFSIFNTMPSWGAPRCSSSCCSARTSSALRTNEKLTMSAWRVTNDKSSMSLAVRADSGRSLSGRLIPLPALRFAPPGRTSVTVAQIWSASTLSTNPPILPSSNQTRWPGSTAPKASASVQPMKCVSPRPVGGAGASERVSTTVSPRPTR